MTLWGPRGVTSISWVGKPGLGEVKPLAQELPAVT